MEASATMAFGLWPAQNQLHGDLAVAGCCKRLGNVMLDIDQLQSFTIGSGLYHLINTPLAMDYLLTDSGAYVADEAARRAVSYGRRAPGLTVPFGPRGGQKSA
jgi:hypothetical protein